ncbi:uncharacterized protein LOC144875890 [Branchiostoma floridae x Branchiostoma japonicum]
MCEATLSGNYHQGNNIFNETSRGKQCTANSLIAILYHSANKQATSWTSTDLDTVLFEGDALYNRIKPSLPPTVSYLSVDDLPNYWQIGNNTLHITIKEQYTGDVFSRQAYYPYYTLQTAIEEAFAISDTCLLITASGSSGSTVALLHTGNKYFVYDSHARSRTTAMPDDNGSSALSRHMTITNLCQFLQTLNWKPSLTCNFELVAVQSENIELTSDVTELDVRYLTLTDNNEPMGSHSFLQAQKVNSLVPPSKSVPNEGTLQPLNLSSFYTRTSKGQHNSVKHKLSAKKQDMFMYQQVSDTKQTTNQNADSYANQRTQYTPNIATETAEQNADRIAKQCTHFTTKKPQTTDKKADRLAKRRECYKARNQRETADKKADRLAKRRECYKARNQRETADKKADRLAKRRECNKARKQRETADKKADILAKRRECYKARKQNETSDERLKKLAKQRLNYRNKAANETSQHRAERLKKCRDYKRNAAAKKYVKEHSTGHTEHNNEEYKSEFPAFHCYIQQQPKYYCILCRKFLFHEQVRACNISVTDAMKYAYQNNSDQCHLCSKCSTAMERQNPIPNAWTNNMDPGDIPPCIKQLTRMETRLVSLKYTFVKLIILPGGQYGEQGQAISFSTNIETSCNLLPRCQNTSGIVIVHPSDTNDRTQRNDPQYIVRYTHMHEALTWLITNNHLYSDVNIASFEDWKETSCEFHSNVANYGEIDQANRSSNVTELSAFPCNYINPNISLQALLQSATDTVPAISLPRETSAPQSIFKEKDLEEHCFPQLYPYGCNGFQQTREIPMTDLQYFQSRLLNINDSWRKNIPWLFFALNSYEIKKLYSQISIVCRMQKQGNDTSQSSPQPLTAGDLRQHIHEDVESTSYTFMKNIRGTAAYFKDQLLNLLAKINTIGPPTWFLTVSANDLNWPELFMSLDPDLTYEEAKALPQQDKWNLMRSDPVMCAIHFNRRTDALLRFILNSPQHPIGVITDHWIRVEFQLRGSPHLHCMFWVENAPNLDTIEGRQRAPEFIDKYVSTQLPDDENSLLHELVSKYQRHHHTRTCEKGRTKCRFHFPREVSQTTRLRLDVDANRSAQFYVTKRTQQDIWINAYSPTLLLHMQSNMDIQMVGSKYGAAYYACMYISKAEPDNLQTAIYAALSHLPPNSTKRARLAQIGNTVLSHRLVGGQEVGYRLANLQLIQSSRQTVSINAKPPHKRMRLLKPKDDLDKLDDSSSDIFTKGTAQYYAMRPHGDPWDTMSLFTFAATYSITSIEPSEASQTIKLQQCDRWIKKRQKLACIRSSKLSSGNGDDYFYGLLYMYYPWRNENDILGEYDCAQDAFSAKKDQFDNSLAQHFHFTSDIEQAIMQVRLLSDDLTSIATTLAPNVTHQQLQSEHDFNTEGLHLDAQWTAQNAEQAAASVAQTNSIDMISSENLTMLHDDSLAWNTVSRYTMADDAFFDALNNMSHDQQHVFNTVK